MRNGNHKPGVVGKSHHEGGSSNNNLVLTRRKHKLMDCGDLEISKNLPVIVSVAIKKKYDTSNGIWLVGRHGGQRAVARIMCDFCTTYK